MTGCGYEHTQILEQPQVRPGPTITQQDIAVIPKGNMPLRMSVELGR